MSRCVCDPKYGEIDFVLPRGSSVLPMEIKSGESYRRHKSLNNVMGVLEWKIGEAKVFCPGNVHVDGPIAYLPWYMLMFCKTHEDAPLLVSW
ncbi:MAG: hypothetical protein IKF78_14890 [Atopobiaceae bacterium]|nr:hypothetical protein [Atopobiaceae bacterium]